MAKALPPLSHHKVVVMGLGLHGGGLSIAQWLYSQRAKVVVTDLKTADQLAPSVAKLDEFCADFKKRHPTMALHPIVYVLGEHREQDFATADLIIKNPDVRANNQYLAIAQAHGVRIENEVTLLFLLTPHTQKIGITGTRGKSTTTTLVYRIMQRAYPGTLLGGNIRVSTIGEILDTAVKNDTSKDPAPIVLELSSWQLALLHDLGMSPHIGVFTNLLPDHLNRYAGMAEYGEDKNAIHRYQAKDDIGIFNFDNEYTREQGSKQRDGRVMWWSHSGKIPGDGVYVMRKDGVPMIMVRQGKKEQVVCPVSDVVVEGIHNLSNVLAAVATTRSAGASLAQIRAEIKNFTGIPYRLEYLMTVQERRIVNDTAATTPVSTGVALRTLGKGRARKIVLIAGGADKNLPFDELAPVIGKTVRAVVLLSGTATPRLAECLAREHYDGEVAVANSMAEAVEKAWRFSRKGDTIILSPACASFGMFTNEFDRGDQFAASIQGLAASKSGTR